MTYAQTIRTADLSNFRELLKLSIECTAEWRARLMRRFPNDDRNEPASKELIRLAETVKDVPDNLMKKYVKFSRQNAESASECESEMLRSVGFNDGFVDAADFVRHLVA